ncbi:hypothetical protein [Noviherbaspirillum humi]|uniref:hypothetical protein n=1 Tax=Noviherbaspirillum humi TaxID=1688639 RepID=UPI001160515C|nr:hypothetical protein [Noviherbaspirillum humi]
MVTPVQTGACHWQDKHHRAANEHDLSHPVQDAAGAFTGNQSIKVLIIYREGFASASCLKKFQSSAASNTSMTMVKLIMTCPYVNETLSS